MSVSESHDKTYRSRRSSIIAGYSAVAISIILIVIKAVAYYMSESLGILSSLIDSMIDSIVSVIALASVYYANRPADSDHRWGHGKMEAVSALFQAAMIASGAMFIIYESLHRLVHHYEMKGYVIGMAVMLISILLSALLVWIQRRSLAESESLAIEADSLHYSSDILINAGALIVIFVTMQGAPYWVDVLFALGVAAFLGKMAYDIVQKALGMLLDKELPEEQRELIMKILNAHPEIEDWHDLRTRSNGMAQEINVDIEVDRKLSLVMAHNIAEDLEDQLLKYLPKADIFIHVDPEGDRTDSRHRVKGVHM